MLDGAKALALEEHRDLHAATAMVANHHNIAVGIDLFAAHRYQMHGDVLGACQLAQLQLPRLAYIKQNRFGPCIVGQPGGKLLYANLLHQKVKLLWPQPHPAPE